MQAVMQKNKKNKKHNRFQRLTVIFSFSVPASVLIASLAMPLDAVKPFTWPGSTTTATPCAGVSSGFTTSTFNHQRHTTQLNNRKLFYQNISYQGQTNAIRLVFLWYCVFLLKSMVGILPYFCCQFK